MLTNDLQTTQHSSHSSGRTILSYQMHDHFVWPVLETVSDCHCVRKDKPCSRGGSLLPRSLCTVRIPIRIAHTSALCTLLWEKGRIVVRLGSLKPRRSYIRFTLQHISYGKHSPSFSSWRCCMCRCKGRWMMCRVNRTYGGKAYGPST